MKVGDRVIMSEIGMYRYMDEPYNPHNTLGVIYYVDDDDDFEFFVTWSNSKSNIYNRDDLQVIQC